MPGVRDKLCLMRPAFRVAAAVVSNLPDDMAADPEGADPKVVGGNSMAWRLARTFYSWLVLSWDKPDLWPAPPEGVSKLELLELSSEIAAGIVGNMTDDLPLDVETADPKVIQANSAAWRVWRTQYAWLCQSLTNAELWPDAPAVGPAPTPGPGPGPGAAPGLNAASLAPALLPAIQLLLSDPDQKSALVSMFQTAMTGGTVAAPPVAKPATPPA